jgi:soluble lytic murein transglycosylase
MTLHFNSHKNRLFIIILLVFFCTGCPSYENTPNPQAEFGADSDYFMGLRFLQEGKEKQARLKFTNCLKKGTYYCAKRSGEELLKSGTMAEKDKACNLLLSRFNDEETILEVCRYYSTCYKYTQVIDLTTNIDYQKADNELCRLRLLSLKAQNSAHYMQDVFNWFIFRPISTEHLQFFTDDFKLPEDIKEYTIKQFLIAFRMDVYGQNYSLACEKAKTVFDLFEKENVEPYEQIVSDIGKSFLYGSSKNINNAANFIKYAKTYKGKPAEFYFWFYSGRFYDKEQKSYFSQAISSYESAIECTNQPKQKDNALWYLLQARINQSYSSTIKELKKYAEKWNDPTYFDDLFESLIPSILASGDFDCFKNLYYQIKDYASKETVSKISYIYARLIQENFISVKDKSEIEQAFITSLNNAVNPYYKILSAYRLKYNDEQMKEVLLKFPGSEPPQVNQDAETLLRGYIAFGFPDYVYPEWKKLYKTGISPETSMEISAFLKSIGKTDSQYLPLSLRVAAYTVDYCTKPLSIDNLKLLYPENFENLVEKMSKKYDIESSIIYALIRTESYFDPMAESVAGAMGLTQLMQMTAQDIAAKFKKTDFIITDPETNIEFGTYYLTQLISRCNDSTILAFFSYNSGITRVRKWQQSTNVSTSRPGNVPQDLFLESIPYSETRGYGRKLVSGSLYYEWIYNYQNIERKPRSFAQIIETFLH